ncbi:MAG TPA: YccF domain-containing protein [Acidimicrobiales bacterium]|nr:YccF domain-containing protein [Acidimicrobiales bacterium]
MRVIGNILWLMLAGLWLAIEYLVSGALLCLTIIGIPFGIQAFKLARLAVLPFGKEIRPA